MPRRSSNGTKPNSKSTWATKILYWLDDQRKLGNSEGYTITASGDQIAAAVGTYRRQVMLALRTLEKREYVATTHQRDPDGRALANKITLLPLAPDKRQRVYQLAGDLGTTPAITIMCLDRLVAAPKAIMRMSLAEVEAVTGYPDGRRLARALVDHGYIVGDAVSWT